MDLPNRCPIQDAGYLGLVSKYGRAEHPGSNRLRRKNRRGHLRSSSVEMSEHHGCNEAGTDALFGSSTSTFFGSPGVTATDRIPRPAEENDSSGSEDERDGRVRPKVNGLTIQERRELWEATLP